MCNWTGWDLREITVTIQSFPDQWPAFHWRKPPTPTPAPTRSKVRSAAAIAWVLMSASRRAVVVASRAGGLRLSVELQARWCHLLVQWPIIYFFRRRWCNRWLEARTRWFGTRRSPRNWKPICPVHSVFHFYYLFSVFTIYFCFLNYY